MILEHVAYTAWCRRCDRSASPAQRDTCREARDDLSAHEAVQHPEAGE